jgi:hypothetical protein
VFEAFGLENGANSAFLVIVHKINFYFILLDRIGSILKCKQIIQIANSTIIFGAPLYDGVVWRISTDLRHYLPCKNLILGLVLLRRLNFVIGFNTKFEPCFVI